jgi:2'-hydroxyisoflavone reductase
MTTRRDVLQISACLAASAAVRAALASNPKTMLILGGTGFIGPHLTQESLRLGWKVTHFNRGKRAAGGVAGVETLIGDRKGQLDSLRGRTWDVVVDDTGYIPKFVKMSAQLLAPNVGYCLFISSISVYASFAKPNDEHSPAGKLSNPDIEAITNDTYGPMKALCEQYSLEAFKDTSASSGPVTSWDPWTPPIVSRTGRCAHRGAVKCSPRARRTIRSRLSTCVILRPG